MKRNYFLKLVVTFVLATFCVSGFSGCGKKSADKDEPSSDLDTSVSTADDDLSGVESEELSFGLGTPLSSETDLSKKEYTAVSALPRESVVSKVSEGKGGYTYFDVATGVFEVTGLCDLEKNSNKFSRLPLEDLKNFSAENASLSKHLAGGRVRFVTDAKTFVLYAEMGQVYQLSYFSSKGAFGFDVYTGTGTNRRYIGASGNHLANATKVHSVVDIGEGYKEVTIVLPSYGGVEKLYIGLPSDSSVAAPDEYKYNDPICFYGSSITQGACVTRPGVAYPNLLTFALDANCYNLGFSGSAKGEKSIAEFIANLKISAFVMDYDYNAPDVAHLEKTHYDFYKTVRSAHPDIPIVILSHPYYADATAEDKARTDVVKATYDKAVSEGDKNVYFVSGADFFPGEYRSIATVDNLHPNDIGHLYMAKAVYPVLKSALEK